MAEDEDELIGALASSIDRRGLATPAVVFLELVKPLSFLCSQALLVIDPVLSPLAGDVGRRCAWLLEDGHRIDGLIEALGSSPLSSVTSDRKEEACNRSATR